MPPRLRFRAVKRVASLGAALLMVAVAGCGGGGGNGGSGSTATSPALAKPVNFPKPGGRSIVQMRSRMSGGPILAPAMSVIIPGENRFSFALFDRSRKQIVGAPVAV